MKIKISQNRIIEVKTKWIIWGGVTVFLIFPLTIAIAPALWSLVDEMVCDQSMCRKMRDGAKEMENIRKDVERLSREEDERHRNQNR